ncbi:MAG: AraC family transcriptional regulator, partial [Ilumatobacteraceae bacterium]
MRSLASAIIVALLATTLTMVPGGAANAVIVQWGTNGGVDPNFEIDVNGDFVMAGNGVLACSGTSVQANAGTCTNLHAATQPSTTNPNVNDYFQMVNSNSVSGFTTNSSSASLTIPAGARVAKAFLNWSANTGTYAGTSTASCADPSFGAATMPAGAASGYASRAIQFRVGTGAIQSFAPASLLQDATTQATARYYSATADVTSAFTEAGSGTALTLSAGNIWAPQGYGCYAGWSVTVIYDYGTYIVGNVNSAPHTVIYYEGHVRQGAQDAALTVDYNGFTAVDVGTRAGFTLYEGDRGITGDTAAYRRGTETAFTQIPNSAGATGNVGIGRGAGSVRYTQTTDASTFTNQSVDVLTQPLSRVVAGDSSVRLQLATSGDSYLLTNSTLSVPTAGLKVEKTFNGTADDQYRTAGEVATFTIRLTNVGAGTLTNFTVADDQTGCARTISGVSLAPLQTYTFTCNATSPTTASYTSTATATATTVVGGFLARGTDSTAVTLSALSLTKTSALAAGGTGRAGDVVNYTFTATNTGGGPLTGVTITDPLTGLSAISPAWPGTAGALAAGQSVTATATRTLTQTDVDAGSVPNTASVVGTDADGGIQPAATAVNTHVIAPAGAITTTKTGTVTSGAGGVGSTITWAIRFTNTGNVTLTNVALTDSLAGLSTPVITWPGTTGRLNPGQVATA